MLDGVGVRDGHHWIRARQPKWDTKSGSSAMLCEGYVRPGKRCGSRVRDDRQRIPITHGALLVGQRTMVANAQRAHLAELGLDAYYGI